MGDPLLASDDSDGSPDAPSKRFTGGEVLVVVLCHQVKFT